ncbi:hypothetical protein NC652_037997 [Populus alba x Populus x berolinensis]|nr:hypothetical protein NC652_037997 [Populus alba x Populus x berolinensis]
MFFMHFISHCLLLVSRRSMIESPIIFRKTEVMNLVESGGFSSSNPYCVVQQGMIPPLTLMKDSECVDVFKEIGGTDVVKA